ncbi:hypothetical protein HYALB_00007648 [Hymenoscyphus albidus]|uniref:Copper transport protein n=1 Tax=Hymenoscyphus albidus TaxID=595503 RepID=A0A9N9PWT0_9HELO|nr:hypothetical protein HYALB_00007648 [Hymenoscyphus albidus]
MQIRVRHGGEDHEHGHDMTDMPATASTTDNAAVPAMADMPGMTAMPGMDMSSGHAHADMKMAASEMSMTFFQSRHTSLYSNDWTPRSSEQFAGTCVFLILLAVIFRVLLALKAWKEAAWMDAEYNRRYVTVAGRGTKGDRMSTDSDGKRMVLSANGAEEGVVVVKKNGMAGRPWRFTVDPIRAFIDTTIAGTGYLLMLAVMTMNVGYFLSVLGGTFLGSLAVGRYMTTGEH